MPSQKHQDCIFLQSHFTLCRKEYLFSNQTSHPSLVTRWQIQKAFSVTRCPKILSNCNAKVEKIFTREVGDQKQSDTFGKCSSASKMPAEGLDVTSKSKTAKFCNLVATSLSESSKKILWNMFLS